MHYLEDNALPAAVILKTAKIDGNYCTLPSFKLYNLICQIGRLFGAKKRTNADIFLFHLFFWDLTLQTYTWQSEIC